MHALNAPIDRRTMLRGAGVAMALPWLESLSVWGDEPAAGGATRLFPKRFAALPNSSTPDIGTCDAGCVWRIERFTVVMRGPVRASAS